MKFLFKEITAKPVEYIILGLIFLLTLISFFIFGFNRRIIYLTSILYFFWSLYHHYHRGDLQINIIIEYLILILLAVVVATL